MTRVRPEKEVIRREARIKACGNIVELFACALLTAIIVVAVVVTRHLIV